MGLSASQGRMLLLTARKSDLEYRAQQISQKRLVLAQQLEEIAVEYEDATSNRQMKISLALASTDSGNDVVNRTANLTYSTLISGTLNQFSPDDSGIQPYDRTANQEYASTTAYRLVDAYGAIVVSSEDEIPGTISKTSNVPTTQDKDGVYRVGSKSSDGQKENNGDNYVVVPKASNGTETALGTFLNSSKDISTKNLNIDTTHQMIEIIKGDGSKVYYNYMTGAEITDENQKNQFESSETATMVNDSSSIPSSTLKTVTNVNKVEGSDGKFSLVDDNGVVLRRYVVDSTLKYGSTDVNGTTDGPNYLQDCLRNGKYLLEKGSIDAETKEVKWNSLSWDTTANISDSYYTEDDDKAKAKYDRLQTQIQNQDKKLELELDNIETQRSAVTTEVESVQKVIDDNIEGSFKTFA